MADKDKVIGRAVYMEFRKETQTYQMMITPDGLNNEGRNVPSTLYRRQISRMTPRRAWRTYALPKLVQDTATGTFKTYGTEQSLDEALTRLNYIDSSFTRLAANGYTLYKQPLIVEVSQSDLEEIRNSKTPYKVLGRITRLRKQNGFGEQLFSE